MRTKLMVLFTLVGLHACIVFAGQATVTNLAATQQLGIASVDTPSPSGSASKALVTAATTGGMPR
ncbi:MAG: hypothetical protein NTV22_05680, partial [bacterium]|nr:hypothetical protein [bacterium]